MNKDLQIIKDVVEVSKHISSEDEDRIIRALKKASSALEILEFKLERTNKVKRTTAILLEETIEELEQKRAAIEKTNEALNISLQDLKMAQAQLIQAEKMASLGELTAGIAHEIQNPLNFVNNFSEVSKELLQEMLEELKNGDTEEVEAIASDVIANLEKILHHGQRADGIVKGMLQHSRKDTGEKEDTDINTLVDEYLRLAYHGLRAKDKSFNAKLITNLDDSIESLQVVPQDLGRVLLNLITNAFHACTEKQKALSELDAEKFHPTVEVSTKKEKDGIKIGVKDNGNGVPQNIKDKIFQPFFTTKPTGQGTGLGLSLSYDIVKAIGGNLTLETKDKEGSIFSIHIPLN
jgi:signal transduction histidine kinase